MTATRHTIRTMRYELKVPSHRAAHQARERISELSAKRTPEILDGLLQQFDRRGHAQIDRLEVDLGAIDIEGWDEVFCARLAEEASVALRRSLSQMPPVQEAAPALWWLNAFEKFIFEGTLPWQAERADFLDLDAAVAKLVGAEALRLKESLLRIAASSVARQRLVGNLRESTVCHLMSLLYSISPADLDLVLGAVVWLDARVGFGKITNARRKRLFESLLAVASPTINDNSASTLLARWLAEFFDSCKSDRPGNTPSLRNLTREPDLPRLLAEAIAHIQSLEAPPSSQRQIVNQPFSNALPNKTDVDVPKPRQDEIPDASWFVRNAGLALLWPYLTRFFTVRRLLKDGQFVNATARWQAAHELEFLVRGSNEYREFDLALNKVLCGIDLREPIPAWESPDLSEVEESERLLQSAIDHWKIIGATSIRGFRQSFLQRDGKLTRGQNSWTLVIDRRGYDVLLDHLPFSLRVIRFPWMTHPLYVEW